MPSGVIDGRAEARCGVITRLVVIGRAFEPLEPSCGTRRSTRFGVGFASQGEPERPVSGHATSGQNSGYEPADRRPATDTLARQIEPYECAFTANADHGE